MDWDKLSGRGLFTIVAAIYIISEVFAAIVRVIL